MAPAVLLSPGRDLAVDQPAAADLLSQTLLDAPHAFLQPSPQLHAAALALAKRYLDPLATSVSDAQSARLQAARRKRKRGEPDDPALRDVLKLRQLHLEGFAADHVWEQARRVLDAGHREVQRCVVEARQLQQVRRAGSPETPAKGAAGTKKRVSFAADVEGSEGSEESESDSEDVDMDGEGLDTDEDGVEEEMSDAEEGAGAEAEVFEEESSGEYFDAAETADPFVKDPNGLNDGFFSIDDFNQQTEFLERQDAKGDPDDGAASDEEEIDWSTDPSMLPLPKKAAMEPNPYDRDPDEESDEEDGPTFGNADLNAPFDSSDDDGEGMAEGDLELDDPASNANEIRYEDFFAPPPQPASKTKPKRLPKTQPRGDDDTSEAEIQRAISDVRHDLFDDNDELSDAAGPEAQDKKNMSSHERRQAAVATQIRALEAQSVAQREWTMSGEARAADRPLNSLLEQDLEFERAGKPVPVVTPEVSSSLEELIKRRILARQFDEVIKRLPGSEGLAPATARRGLVDIDERAPDQGLGDAYEEEHARATDPNFVDRGDAKLQAAHAQIERLWRDVSGKLDVLSNWHYRPKPADVSVSVVTDAPRVAMEDARPGGAGISTEQSGLAPQEVYRAGEAREKGEVATKAGAVLGTAELTREQKLRRKRREKERGKKRAGNGALAPQGLGKPGATVTKSQEKKNVVDDLKKGGVKVIGKGGELVDVEGKKIKAAPAANGAGNFKL